MTVLGAGGRHRHAWPAAWAQNNPTLTEAERGMSVNRATFLAGEAVSVPLAEVAKR